MTDSGWGQSGLTVWPASATRQCARWAWGCNRHGRQCVEPGQGAATRSSPLPSHTTGHAGPHPAVRKVEVTSASCPSDRCQVRFSGQEMDRARLRSATVPELGLVAVRPLTRSWGCRILRLAPPYRVARTRWKEFGCPPRRPRTPAMSCSNRTCNGCARFSARAATRTGRSRSRRSRSRWRSPRTSARRRGRCSAMRPAPGPTPAPGSRSAPDCTWPSRQRSRAHLASTPAPRRGSWARCAPSPRAIPRRCGRPLPPWSPAARPTRRSGSRVSATSSSPPSHRCARQEPAALRL